VDLLSIILAASGSLSALGTMAYWLLSRKLGIHKSRQEEMDSRIHVAFAPLHTDLTELHAKFDAFADSRPAAVKVAVQEALEPVKDQLAVLNTKVEPLWKSLEALAISNAQMIHKPHPDHAHIDELLDAYVAFAQGNGPFTVDQELQLRHYLNIIKAWRPGKDVGFPVEVGDPTRAAIVLATMELTRIRHKQEQK
jgi:hypothetical protein